MIHFILLVAGEDYTTKTKYRRQTDKCAYLKITVRYVTAFVPAKLIILVLAKHFTIILHTHNILTSYSSSNKTISHISSCRRILNPPFLVTD